MVNSYKELLEKWGEELDRNELSFEDELDYINDWYHLGENFPTKPFEPNFSDYNKYKGQEFIIQGTVSYVLDDVDLEVLPMWKIKMPDGEIIWADCSEIFDWDKIEE